MSWSPHLYIGEFRPWPESIYVTRDKTDETRRYVLEKYDSAMQCLQSLENSTLRELVRDMWRGAMQRMDYAERYAFTDEFVDRIRALEVDV